MRVLHHVTLTTGHVGLTARPEIGDDVLSSLRPLVSDLLAGDGMIPRTRDIPTRTGFIVQCLVIHGPASPLWRDLHVLPDAAALPATKPDHPPDAVPWCAVTIHTGLLAAPDTVVWLGDFERCIAWSVVEIAEGIGA